MIDARMQRVLRHIDGHLETPLPLEALAAVAGLSPHHFHRAFRTATGLTALRYVQGIRLRRASFRLAFRSDMPIIAVALDAGYQSPEAFARAFRRWFGQSPSTFRASPDWPAWSAALAPLAGEATAAARTSAGVRRVTLLTVPDVPVAVLRHQGPPHTLGDSLRRFIAWRRRVGLPPRRSATFNILHGDPRTTPPQDFRLDLCAATGRAVADDEAGVVAGVIPGGRVAVLRHVGPEHDLGRSIDWLCRDWLAASGERRRADPPYLQRLALFPDVAETEAVTDVFLPLAPAP